MNNAVEFQARYVAYARAHGSSPREMLAREASMAGYIEWIGTCWAAWRAANGGEPTAPLSFDQHAAFDRRLFANTRWGRLSPGLRLHAETFAEFLATAPRNRSDELHERVQMSARAIPGPLHLAAMVRGWVFRASLTRQQLVSDRLRRRGVDGVTAWATAGALVGSP